MQEKVKYPHKMYDPKTGKEVEAKPPEDHDKYAKMGYTHDKPKKEAMDPVNKAAVKKKFDDRKDKDIDNDGDVDSSDKFLHKRRKAISKAMADSKEFIYAAKMAKKNGEKTFTIGGKQYDVEEALNKEKQEGYHDKDKKKKMIDDDASNDKSDDGDGLDKVDPKAAKKKFADRKDKDIDNDGDVDDSDKFLHKRRKAIV